jgi:hypothetical protein
MVSLPRFFRNRSVCRAHATNEKWLRSALVMKWRIRRRRERGPGNWLAGHRKLLSNEHALFGLARLVED